eukprot:10180592-Lingulodinium_polyedra.AAC.1
MLRRGEEVLEHLVWVHKHCTALLGWLNLCPAVCCQDLPGAQGVPHVEVVKGLVLAVEGLGVAHLPIPIFHHLALPKAPKHV